MRQRQSAIREGSESRQGTLTNMDDCLRWSERLRPEGEAFSNGETFVVPRMILWKKKRFSLSLGFSKRANVYTAFRACSRRAIRNFEAGILGL
jgi:hypothetical protein